MRPRSPSAMRQQCAALMLLYLMRCAVQAYPFQAREMIDPLDSLKSVASELFNPAAATSGRLSSANAKITPSYPLATATLTESSTATVQTSAGGTGYPTVSSSRSTSIDSITVSGTATQLPTGGVSVSTPPSQQPYPTTTFDGSITTSPRASGTTLTATPTTTGGDGSLSSGTGSGSTSDPGLPDSGSGAGGAGQGSGSDPGSRSGSGTSASLDHSSGLSSGAIVAATLLPALAFTGLIFLLVWLCPPLRRKYGAWRRQRVEKHAYRRALDDPVLSFGVQEKGLGLGDVEQLMLPLSFGFAAPQRPEIRRKPLNWDATRVGSDEISAIGMAVPMGEHRRTASESSEEDDTARYEDARSNQVSPEARIS